MRTDGRLHAPRFQVRHLAAAVGRSQKPPGPVDRDRIFKTFERLNERTEYPGVGMGLAMVKTAVERMGGKVGLESRLGEGSRFWVELPRCNDA